MSATEVSLIIPVRNETQTLPALIASIRQQTLRPTEVIIVDGGSTDDTVALARRLTADDERFRIIEAGPATPGRGRNVGSAAARCAWLAYTDAGIRVEPTWLERLVQEVERDPALDVVFGNYEPVAGTRFERWAALAFITPKQNRPNGRVRGPVVPSSLMKRELWATVGGFPDLRAAEDMIFVERVQAQAHKVGWAPHATVWWQLPPSLGRTFRRFALYSRHNVWAGRQHDWHYSVARNYLLGLPFLILALVHSAYWLLVPIMGTLARVAKMLWVRREGRDLWWLLNPVQLLGVGLILLTIDLATFVGWAQATVLKQRYRE
ncbi:MAG TPA: glycosyltransferase [Pyrinomonadaceae bacterium]|jgi:glycosyltransferase involved in cell wall biosynthesis